MAAYIWIWFASVLIDDLNQNLNCFCPEMLIEAAGTSAAMGFVGPEATANFTDLAPTRKSALSAVTVTPAFPLQSVVASQLWMR
jgi:hypothetical protein